MDTLITKDNWTKEHYNLFNSIPAIVRNIAGDLFEMKWYSHHAYSDIIWELKNNFGFNENQVIEFEKAYNSLTKQQKNLIYYAYEA